MAHRIIVLRDDGLEIDVTEAVQITYDCLRSSLDWGSGFLDTNETHQVILLAEAAGFADFEDAVTEVWLARNPHLVHDRRKEEAQRRGVDWYEIPEGEVVTDAERAAILHEAHQGPTQGTAQPTLTEGDMKS